MESIPLSQITNAPLITSGTQNTALSTNARPIPAEVQLSPEGDSIILNGTEYNLKLVNAQQRQALIIASQFLVNQVVNSPSESSAMIQTSQLIALGSTVNLKLPEAITLLAQQNGISETKLYALSARPQGYPSLMSLLLQKNSNLRMELLCHRIQEHDLMRVNIKQKLPFYKGNLF